MLRMLYINVLSRYLIMVYPKQLPQQYDASARNNMEFVEEGITLGLIKVWE
jgi:hypothetical protein